MTLPVDGRANVFQCATRIRFVVGWTVRRDRVTPTLGGAGSSGAEQAEAAPTAAVARAAKSIFPKIRERTSTIERPPWHAPRALLASGTVHWAPVAVQSSHSLI